MTLATCNDVNINRQTTSDPRFDMRLSEKFVDEDASSVGWTWVAAILIAGTLIVSGYLDQESALSNLRTTATGSEKYAANSANAQSTRVTGADVDRDKGY
ncbi:MAG: hypothetical protein ABI583_03645 [Betaproteobacteria bacterium]